MKANFAGIILFLYICSCHSVQPNFSHLVLRMKGSSLDSVFLTKTGFLDSLDRPADAGVLYSSKDSLIFFIPKSAENLYQIRFMYSGWQVYFIPDQDSLQVWLDNKTGDLKTAGSPATASLQTFIRMQNDKTKLSETRKMKPDSLLQGKPVSVELKARLRNKLFLADSLWQEKVKSYCDTVSNPAAFMFAYNSFQPYDSYLSSIKLVRSAEKRFPDFKPLQQIKKDLDLQVDIYEQELQRGDQLPEFSLPDLNGRVISSRDWKGKYYFLDFWASWCPLCNSYQQVKKELFGKTDSRNFRMISVAMDDRVEICKRLVESNGLAWTQLMDVKIWKGAAVSALKFDSIPFNFLVSPEGKILDKAIPADSLLIRVKTWVR